MPLFLYQHRFASLVFLPFILAVVCLKLAAGDPKSVFIFIAFLLTIFYVVAFFILRYRTPWNDLMDAKLREELPAATPTLGVNRVQRQSLFRLFESVKPQAVLGLSPAGVEIVSVGQHTVLPWDEVAHLARAGSYIVVTSTDGETVRLQSRAADDVEAFLSAHTHRSS